MQPFPTLLFSFALNLGAHASLTTITTSTTTTFFVVGCTTTQLKPTPSGADCGLNGTLKTPSLEKPAYTIPSTNPHPLDTCRNACFVDSNCISFAFEAANLKCSQYNESLGKMGLGQTGNKNGIFHYAKKCFASSCTTQTDTQTITILKTQTVSSTSSLPTLPPPPPTTTTGPPPLSTPPSSTTSIVNSCTSVPPPQCTDAFNPNVGCYLNYYSGSCESLDPDNPGNTGAQPLLTTYYDGGYTLCAVATGCANLNNSTGPYYSFALYYLNAGYWQCTRYPAQNENGEGPPGQFFNVSNSAVVQAYGFNLYSSCLNG